MVTRKKTNQPEHAKLTVDQMQKGIKRLERIITELEQFDPSTLTKRWSNEQRALETTIEGALSSIFGHGSIEYSRYADATSLDQGPVTMSVYGGISSNAAEARQHVTEGKQGAIQTLRMAVRWLSDEIADAAPTTGSTTTEAATPPVARPRKVFIVHGHDDGTREAVARFAERIGLDAVILKEQANQGRTIIEKIEAHGDVGFAIVLLTPDDVGSKAGSDLRPRPRQNVLLELGYFIGRLGRQNVCALSTDSTMEIPTDFAGVVWEAFDASGGWKLALGRELEAAGFEIDWNKAMKA